MSANDLDQPSVAQRAIAELTTSTNALDVALGWLLAEIRQHHDHVPTTVLAAAAHTAQAAIDILDTPAPSTLGPRGGLNPTTSSAPGPRQRSNASTAAWASVTPIRGRHSPAQDPTPPGGAA